GRGGARSGGCGERGILAYPPARRKGGGVGMIATVQTIDLLYLMVIFTHEKGNFLSFFDNLCYY
ncbi:MAG TPA: hypothetical protein PKJ68_06220, partial [Candidatus Woesebacteria bacterium]|nr:hypothetical protein [Candidatus Woesebacteria bacterium]